MARLSGLGKGLGALIPNDTTTASGTGDQPRLEDIAVSAIEPNPLQPRLHFDEEALAELAESVREIGVLQPVLVRPLGDGTFQLIAGERRWRAASRAGRWPPLRSHGGPSCPIPRTRLPARHRT